MRKLDLSEDVKKWSSEEVRIPYIDKGSGRARTYFVDFYVEKTNGQKYLIEVKPSGQTVPPQKKKGQHTKTYLKEVETWCTNTSKWAYASRFAEARGMKFIIMTEKELGIKT